MPNRNSVGIPPASSVVFQGAIVHPDLWLWDSWVLRQADAIHLYCLALSRQTLDGIPVRPQDRNQFNFHVRHFVSVDEARTWRDLGCFAQSGAIRDGSDSHNIWSGSVATVPGDTVLFSHTGIRKAGPGRPFLQSINLVAAMSPDTPLSGTAEALLCADRDYDMIRAAGYYLGPRASLGDQDGEEGGPILSWRDPYIFVDADKTIHLFIAAKTGPKTPAIAHALLEGKRTGFKLKGLRPPLQLPDSELYTQAEMPKVYRDQKRETYYMLISASDRLYEGQPDDEISKEHRLFKAASLNGPWQPYHKADSLLPGLSGRFGSSLISSDFDTGDLTFISPFTEKVSAPSQLTFAPAASVNIYADPVFEFMT